MSYVDKVKDRNGEVADIHDTGARQAIENIPAFDGEIDFESRGIVGYIPKAELERIIGELNPRTRQNDYYLFKANNYEYFCVLIHKTRNGVPPNFYYTYRITALKKNLALQTSSDIDSRSIPDGLELINEVVVGTKLYLHDIVLKAQEDTNYLKFVDNNPTPLNASTYINRFMSSNNIISLQVKDGTTWTRGLTWYLTSDMGGIFIKRFQLGTNVFVDYTIELYDPSISRFSSITDTVTAL